MTNVKRTAYLIWIVFTSLLWAVSLTVLTSPLVYRWMIGPLNLTAISGMSSDQLQTSFMSIWRYLLNPFQKDLVITYFSSSPEGLIHFHDVKVLILLTFVLAVISLILLIYFSRSFKRQIDRRWFQRHYFYTYLTPLVFLGLVIISFERLFLYFHQLLFRNDYWIFNPLYDPIINVLPEQLFLVYFIVAIFLFECILYIIQLSLKWRK